MRNPHTSVSQASSAGGVGPPPVADLEARVTALEKFKNHIDELRKRTKWLIAILGCILAFVGFANFLTKVVREGLQRYLSIPSLDQIGNIVWKELSDQVATSFSWSFSLGTDKTDLADDASMNRYMSMPFFAPADLSGVSICYRVLRTGGTTNPRPISIRIDESSADVSIPPGDAGEPQHTCLMPKQLKEKFGAVSVASGAIEHKLQFVLAGPVPGDRKQVTVLVNVVGRLKSEGGG